MSVVYIFFDIKNAPPKLDFLSNFLGALQVLQMCFLLVYSLLLKITANAIIKAIAMIVTPINE